VRFCVILITPKACSSPDGPDQQWVEAKYGEGCVSDESSYLGIYGHGMWHMAMSEWNNQWIFISV